MTLDLLRAGRTRGLLDGQVLVAMPGMADERFARSVVYLCAHSGDGAMGIVVNRRAPGLNFPDLLVQLDVIEPSQAIRVKERAGGVQVLRGGPVESGRGFVIHSSDYRLEDATLAIDERVSLTATLDVLRAIAGGDGPARCVLALGYAGWAPGQLEGEIAANGWLHGPADEALIFGADHEAKYERALRLIGVDPGMLSSEVGHA